MKRAIVVAAVAVLFLAASIGRATELSKTGQPLSHTFSFEPPQITGFGAATFGMTVDEVLAVARRDYPGAEIVQDFEPVRQTALIHVGTARLAPIPESPAVGPVSITYVFGYSSKRLTAVNVNWYTEGDATAGDRDALLKGGTDYVADLLRYAWEPFNTFRGLVIGPNTVLLFSGQDEFGRSVEVIVDGVDLEVVSVADGVTTYRPAEPGPAALHIGVAERPDDPDVFTIPPGSF